MNDPGRRRAEAGDAGLAAQCNAFVVAQADRQWMHQVDVEVPVSRGPFRTLTAQRMPAYGEGVLSHSRRRGFAAREYERSSQRIHLRDIRVLWPAGTRA